MHARKTAAGRRNAAGKAQQPPMKIVQKKLHCLLDPEQTPRPRRGDSGHILLPHMSFFAAIHS
jgi:hypothetical protein